MVFQGLRRKGIGSSELLLHRDLSGKITKLLLILSILTILLQPTLAFKVKPANVSDKELEERIKNDVADEVKTTFWDLPLWIKIQHILSLAIALIGIWKFLPIFLGKIRHVLQNRKRRKILQLIAASRGISVREIEDALAMNRSTLRYHLDQLEKEGLIISFKLGKEKLIFLRGAGENVRIAEAFRSEVRRKILELMVNNGSLSQSEIADFLKLNRKTVHYHVKHLKTLGIVEGDRVVGLTAEAIEWFKNNHRAHSELS